MTSSTYAIILSRSAGTNSLLRRPCRKMSCSVLRRSTSKHTVCSQGGIWTCRSMTGFDWALVAIVVFSALMAAAEGFFFEIFFLAGSVAGYLLAAWDYSRVAPWFEQFVSAPWIASAAGFCAIFFGVILLAGMAGRVSRWIFKQAGLQWIDRALGAVF